MIDPLVMTPHQQQYEEFLLLLDRDPVNFVYCYYCKKLHCLSRTKSIFPNPDSLEKPCSVVARVHANYPYLHNLHFGQMQMGNETPLSQPQHPHSTRRKVKNKGDERDIERLRIQVESLDFRSDTQIRKGRLLLRSEHTVSFPARPLPLLPWY